MESEAAVVDSFIAYLTTLNTSLWGRAWDVSSDDGRRAAAEWFCGQAKRWVEGQG